MNVLVNGNAILKLYWYDRNPFCISWNFPLTNDSDNKVAAVAIFVMFWVGYRGGKLDQFKHEKEKFNSLF